MCILIYLLCTVLVCSHTIFPVNRKADDSCKLGKYPDSEVKFEETPRIRVCFKEPADDDESIEQEYVYNVIISINSSKP